MNSGSAMSSAYDIPRCTTFGSSQRVVLQSSISFSLGGILTPPTLTRGICTRVFPTEPSVEDLGFSVPGFSTSYCTKGSICSNSSSRLTSDSGLRRLEASVIAPYPCASAAGSKPAACIRISKLVKVRASSADKGALGLLDKLIVTRKETIDN